MKKFFKDNWKFLLFVLIGGLVGGYFLGLYMYDSLSPDMLKQIEEQNGNRDLVAISSMIQYGIIYGVVLAAVGIIFSKKVNLWKEFKFDKKGMIVTIIFTVIGALMLFPGDKIIFGSLSTFVRDQYYFRPTIAKIIGGFLVGGIIEEVMLRLFMMSLITLLIKMIFYNKKEMSVYIYVIANIISALLFAAGHIPSTMAMTSLTPVLIFRCFLLNGGFGLCFGYLYRKYGLGYAMLSHGFVHLIADTLMLIFI
jgi:hypothetical protein